MSSEGVDERMLNDNCTLSPAGRLETEAKCRLCKEFRMSGLLSAIVHDMTNAIIEIPAVGVQLPEWPDSMQRSGKTAAHVNSSSNMG